MCTIVLQRVASGKQATNYDIEKKQLALLMLKGSNVYYCTI